MGDVIILAKQIIGAKQSMEVNISWLKKLTESTSGALVKINRWNTKIPSLSKCSKKYLVIIIVGLKIN